MLDEVFAMGDSYQDCDTTTPQGISTPFSVKDILNLNMTNNAEYNGEFHAGHQVKYEDFYQQHYWDSAYEQFNYGVFGGLQVKSEYPCLDKEFGCESGYGISPHVQQYSGACGLMQITQEGCKEFKGDSPSKYNFLQFHNISIMVLIFPTNPRMKCLVLAINCSTYSIIYVTKEFWKLLCNNNKTLVYEITFKFLFLAKPHVSISTSSKTPFFVV